MSRLLSIVIHCHDPYVLAPFWSVVTGLPIVPEDAESLGAHTLESHESVLLGTRAGLHLWITPAQRLLEPGRIHLDIAGTDMDRAAILAAGATIVREAKDWTVMADPEGNEFCLVPTP